MYTNHCLQVASNECATGLQIDDRQVLFAFGNATHSYTKLDLLELLDDQISLYAILPHRWENEELSFHDFYDGLGLKLAG